VKRLAAALLGPVLGLLALAACSNDGRTLRAAGPNQTLSIITTTTTPTTTRAVNATTGGFAITAPWSDGALIDAQYTCRGADVSPAISWGGVPVDTVELALTFVDLDADDYAHWIVAGIDPATQGIAAGKVPTGAIEGANGFGEAKYGGPCPPDGEHTYLMTLYALGAKSNLANGVNAQTAIDLLQSSQLASAVVSGRFG
jgi:Raf kinase inhibitor-like YbhB/YbcL family protein